MTKRPRLRVALAVLSLGFVTGCANLSSHCNIPQNPPGTVAGCLPVEGSEVPPAAAITIAHRCVDPLPDDAIPAPAGTYLSQWRGTMAQGAQEHHWFVSRNQWFDGGSQLGPLGRKHVQRIAQCFAMEPQTVVIESEPVALELGQNYDEALRSNQQLNAERRNAIVTTLADVGAPDPDAWVVFAGDRDVGVRGIEGPQIFNRQFIQAGQGNRGSIGRGQGTGLGGGIGGGMGGLGGGIGGIGGGMGGIGGGGFGGGGIF